MTDAARLALEVYIHRLRAGIGAMAASLGGLDALVFTGGVGENSERIRDLACEGLAHLGVGPPEDRVRVLVVHARERDRAAGTRAPRSDHIVSGYSSANAAYTRLSERF
jgi:acetate kinase